MLFDHCPTRTHPSDLIEGGPTKSVTSTGASSRLGSAAMLLNQCLAISVSPDQVRAGAGASAKTGPAGCVVQPQSLASADRSKSPPLGTGIRCDHNRAAPKADEKHQRQQQASQLISPASLFRRLVETNSPSALKQERTGTRRRFLIELPPPPPLVALEEALKRVEFVGFVVPSWLLLTGSFDDLSCIKASWRAGRLCPPPGFKIETIGK